MGHHFKIPRKPCNCKGFGVFVFPKCGIARSMILHKNAPNCTVMDGNLDGNFSGQSSQVQLPSRSAKYERMVRMKREKEKARQALRSISGRHNLKCYTAMGHAVDVSVENYPTKLSMKVIGREVGHRMEKPFSPSAASRALARAAVDIWENGCRENLVQIYGHRLNERPTAQSVIYAVSEYAVQRVTYEIHPILGVPGDYTIVAREGDRSAAVAVLAQNAETLQRLIEIFNERQLPLDTFLELYLSGKLIGTK